jgi:acyl transferase domain-containing protein
VQFTKAPVAAIVLASFITTSVAASFCSGSPPSALLSLHIVHRCLGCNGYITTALYPNVVRGDKTQGGVAMLSTDQGPYAVNMGKDMYSTEDLINDTEFTQPCLFAFEYALAQLSRLK